MGDEIMKILIIEDDNIIRSGVSYILSSNGYEVLDCKLIREAAALLTDNIFDLIISDIGLPDGNGLDFCSQYKDIPFIVMSGWECSELAKANGAKAYVKKPFGADDILTAIAAL
ncbi:MAG: response regulator [Clostridiales bacterium]|nr:response regulator [Clostridiales bacterium]